MHIQSVLCFVHSFVCVSDEINNETLILFYLPEGLIASEQKLAINNHSSIIPPQTSVGRSNNDASESHRSVFLLLFHEIALIATIS